MGKRYRPTDMSHKSYWPGSGEYEYDIKDDSLVAIAGTVVGAKFKQKLDSAKAIKAWMKGLGLNFRGTMKQAELTDLRAEYIEAAKKELVRRRADDRRVQIDARVDTPKTNWAEVLNSTWPEPSVAKTAFKFYRAAVDNEVSLKDEFLRAAKYHGKNIYEEAEKALKGDNGYADFLRGYQPLRALDPTEVIKVHSKWQEAREGTKRAKEMLFTMAAASEEISVELDYFLPGGKPFTLDQISYTMHGVVDGLPLWEGRIDGWIVARGPIAGAAQGDKNPEAQPWFHERIKAEDQGRVEKEAEKVSIALGYGAFNGGLEAVDAELADELADNAGSNESHAGHDVTELGDLSLALDEPSHIGGTSPGAGDVTELGDFDLNL